MKLKNRKNAVMRTAEYAFSRSEYNRFSEVYATIDNELSASIDRHLRVNVFRIIELEVWWAVCQSSKAGNQQSEQ